MCGRYAVKRSLEQIAEEYGAFLQKGYDWKPLNNAWPFLSMPVILEEEEREVRLHHWSLIPFWAKDIDIRNKTKNARSETVDKLPSFRSAFKSRRCVVPMQGFYEWDKSTNPSTPYYVFDPSGDSCHVAGLYEHWESPEGQKIDSFTILTAKSNEKMSHIHDRMPCFLYGREVDEWMASGNNGKADLKDLLRPAPNEAIDFYSVSRKINAASLDNQDHSLLDPV